MKFLKNLIVFLLGVLAAPFITKALKPVAREAMRGGMMAGEQLRRMAAEVREDLEDLAAEAAVDLKPGKK